MSNARELFSALWNAADEMRAKMSADLLENRSDMPIEEAQKLYEQAEKDGKEDWTDLCEELKNTYGCFIKPQYTFTAFYNQINSSEFLLENLKQAFREIEKSQGSTYDGLFDDFDIQSRDLGKNPMECNMLISAVIKALAGINFAEYGDDALGDAYEYLIAQFASESGKKAGEFYTPQAVSKIIAKIVTLGREKSRTFLFMIPAADPARCFCRLRTACIKREIKTTASLCSILVRKLIIKPTTWQE